MTDKRTLSPLHLIVFFALAIVGQNADLVTKHAAFSRIRERETVEAVRGLLQFERTYNTGIVFGLGQEWGGTFLVISVLAVPLIVWIYLSVKETRWITTVSLGLILAGTLGNMYDRVTIGMVRDFIKFHPDLFEFPIFNLADSFICVGVFLMVIDILVFDRKKKEKPVEPAPVHETTPVQGETAARDGR